MINTILKPQILIWKWLVRLCCFELRMYFICRRSEWFGVISNGEVLRGSFWIRTWSYWPLKVRQILANVFLDNLTFHRKDGAVDQVIKSMFLISFHLYLRSVMGWVFLKFLQWWTGRITRETSIPNKLKILFLFKKRKYNVASNQGDKSIKNIHFQ